MPNPQKSTKKSRIPDVLTPVDTALIATVYRYYFVTIEQVTRALYKPGSYSTVKNRLASLEKRGYLLSLYYPTVKKGNSPKIYSIAREGLNVLKEQEYDVPARFHPSEQKEKTYFFLHHTLSVNDVLIACANMEKSFPQIKLARMIHERWLRLEPEKYPIGIFSEDGKLLREEIFTLIPDAFVEFHIEQGTRRYRSCILFEVDRDTTEAKRFKKKIRAYITYLKTGRFTKKYKARSVTIAYATTGGKARVEQMQEWTREELSKTHEGREFGNTFVFAALPKVFDSEWLLLSDVWVFAFQGNKGKFALLSSEVL